MKLARNSNRESQRFRLVVFVIGCFLVSMTFIVVSQPQSLPFPILGLKPRVHVAPSTPKTEQTIHSQQPGGVSGQDNATEQSKQEIERDIESQEKSMKADDPRAHQDEAGGEINLMMTTKDTATNSAQKETLPGTTDKLESDNGMQERNTKTDESNSDGGELRRKFTLPTISNYTINDSFQVENASNAEQLGSENKTKGGSTACDPNSGNCEKNREARPQEDTNPAIAHPTQEDNTSNSTQLGTLAIIEIC
ncbi:putative alpha-1,3-arabinosyltransferase XAT2 [Cocos nucifera]|uniref:Putative alpha-1,3-arabinosyltransferase XAT2 n=1 Tax=Cocos nucifera TaxID=13894 RepID=A0A8K0I3F3_COCNU|nr:putative alpha-1,3-arabinosyltransferase XAT2 [Cocos nucifera]